MTNSSSKVGRIQRRSLFPRDGAQLDALVAFCHGTLSGNRRFLSRSPSPKKHLFERSAVIAKFWKALARLVKDVWYLPGCMSRHFLLRFVLLWPRRWFARRGQRSARPYLWVDIGILKFKSRLQNYRGLIIILYDYGLVGKEAGD